MTGVLQEATTETDEPPLTVNREMTPVGAAFGTRNGTFDEPEFTRRSCDIRVKGQDMIASFKVCLLTTTRTVCQAMLASMDIVEGLLGSIVFVSCSGGGSRATLN